MLKYKLDLIFTLINKIDVFTPLFYLNFHLLYVIVVSYTYNLIHTS